MNIRIFALVLLPFIPSLAEAEQPSLPLVSTSGTATVRVVPDLVDIRLEVEIRGTDLTAARKEQGERTTRVLAALRAAGVAETELQTSQILIAPNYTDNRQETEKVRFYSVSQIVSCTLRDLKKMPDLVGAVVAAGATSVERGNYRSNDLTKHRAEARSKAVRAAKDKAIALATELGAKVGKPHTISETASSDWGGGWGNVITANVVSQPIFASGNGETSFAPGTISITETVSVSFLLE